MRLDPDERHKAELRRKGHRERAPQREEKRKVTIRLLNDVRRQALRILENAEPEGDK